MTSLKKLFGIKSFNSIQNSIQQDQKSVVEFLLSSFKKLYTRLHPLHPFHIDTKLSYYKGKQNC